MAARNRRRERRIAVFAAGLLAAAVLHAETWYEAYDKAEQALAGERWAEAVEHVTAALAEQPRSSHRLRTYGMRFVAYHPYLKLGVAYYHLGQLDAALQAFETEERQGAVARSADARAELASFRSRIEGERAAAVAARQDRSRRVIAESLEAVHVAESEGRIDDAFAALGNVLAVAPEHGEAKGIRGRLLAAVAERERRREDDAQLAAHLDRGERAMAEGRFAVAAASFREALAVRDDARARELHDRAQERLRATIDARRAERPAADGFASLLARAGDLERAGDVGAAIATLQEALAREPGHAEARAMEERLVDRARADQAADLRRDDVAELLAAAEEALLAGDDAAALRSVHRALAIDAENEPAARQVARIYARLNRTLLAADTGPPAIVLDQRRDLEEHQPLTVRVPELVITGRVYDSTPVELIVQAGSEPVGSTAVTGREVQGMWITDFRWHHRLRAGASDFQVVAIDRDGNRTDVPLAVIYTVPFLRSLWFPAGVGLVLAVAGGGLVGLRSHRRRRLLRGRFNPYVAGAPILEHARYFGRSQLLDYVLRRIGNNSVMLYGERRIGKTSFQHNLKRCLSHLDDPDHAFFPVYIDLQGTPQERFFATLAAEVFYELGPKLEGMQPDLPPRQEAYGYRELVKDLHRVLEALGGRTRRKVKLVLLIDEVDELNDYDPRINQRLRSLFMRAFADNLVAVVSGVAIKKHWEREGSPWYNFFQEIEVKPLDPEEARALIEAPVRGIFTFEEGTADAIIRRTDAKPYLIQRLCSSLVDRLHEERRKRVSLADVEAACRIEGLR